MNIQVVNLLFYCLYFATRYKDVVGKRNSHAPRIQCREGFFLIAQICVRVQEPSIYRNCRLINHRNVLHYLQKTPRMRNFLLGANITEFWVDKRLARTSLQGRTLRNFQNDWMQNVTSLTYNVDLINFRNCYKYNMLTFRLILTECQNVYPRLCTYDPLEKQLLRLACPRGTTSVIFSNYQNRCFYVDVDSNKHAKFNGRIFRPRNLIEKGIHQELVKNAVKHLKKYKKITVEYITLKKIKKPELQLMFNETDYKLLLNVSSPAFILRRNNERKTNHYGILCYMEYSVAVMTLTPVYTGQDYSILEVNFVNKFPRLYYCEATQIYYHRNVYSNGQKVVAHKHLANPIFAVEMELKLNIGIFLNLLTGITFSNSSSLDDIILSTSKMTKNLVTNIEFIKINSYDVETNRSRIVVHIEVEGNYSLFDNNSVVKSYRELNTSLWNLSQDKRNDFRLVLIKSTQGCITDDMQELKFNQSVTMSNECEKQKEVVHVGVCYGDKVYGGELQNENRVENKFCLNEADINRLIKFICHILSLFGILVIILTAILFKNWRNVMSNQLILNLSLTLGVFFVLIFITSTLDIDWDSNWKLIFNVFISYFRLSSFIWSLMIAVRLYIIYVRVFTTHLLENFFMRSALISYGLPIIPSIARILVIILACKDELMYSDCNADTDVVIYGFSYPISLSLVINLIIFGCILFSIFRKAKVRKNSSRSKMEKRINWNKIRISVISFILLSLVWIFYLMNRFIVEITGTRYVGVDYFFEVLVSLQGFILFIYFILIISNTRKMWSSFLCRK